MRDDSLDLKNGTDDKIRRVYKSIAGEQELRIRADQDIRKQIKEIETGGLYISAMGATFLFGGIIMATIPVESAAIVQAMTGFDTSGCD
jgi:hypothetical protein